MNRYETTSTDTRWDGKRVYLTTSYQSIQPKETDTIVLSRQGDYLDKLAFDYYGDPTLWWVIALANNLGKSRLSIPPGLQLRIPTDIAQILSDFNTLNS